MLTNQPIWLHLHSLTLLPNPTTWPVKYTHAQRTQHRPTHGSRGHCPVPQDDTVASDSEHSVRHLHPRQLIHIPPTHLRACALQQAGQSTTPPRDIGDSTTTHTRSAEHTGSRAGDPHPTTTSSWAYDCESCCEANNFGKEFLRMAGIVQMLHILQPPYGARSYIVVCQPNQNSTSTTDPYTHPRSSQIITRVGVHHSWMRCQCVPPVSASAT